MSSPSSDDPGPLGPDDVGEGCGWCRGHYYAWSTEEPELLGTIDDGELVVRRCHRCGTFWIENVFTFPRRVSETEARRTLGDSA